MSNNPIDILLTSGCLDALRLADMPGTVLEHEDLTTQMALEILLVVVMQHGVIEQNAIRSWDCDLLDSDVLDWRRDSHRWHGSNASR